MHNISKGLFAKLNWQVAIFALALLLSGIFHAYNMFHFPYYENDEGTYMSQAWSLLNSGQLAPYAYWYDHAPAGWILIAFWVKLTGGFFTFGPSVNSGRVLMLILHLFSTFFLLKISQKLTKSLIPGLIAATFFSLSPLGLYFQRRVLLDNIMTFWVLLSLLILLQDKLKLKHVFLSALAFGIAVLSKENAIFFIPGFLYAIYLKSQRTNRVFALIKWLAVSFIVISFYFLYALFKGEFFPVGFLGNFSQHVSLITSFKEQLSRGSNLPQWDPNSDFYVNMSEWISRDPYSMIGGVAATLIVFLLGIKNKPLRIWALLSGFFLIFILRGKLILDFYVIPLLPLLDLSIGVVVYYLLQKISFGKKGALALMVLSIMLTAGTLLWSHQFGQFTRDETTPQVQTIDWIKSNLPGGTEMVIDDSIYVDLHDARYPGDKVFPHADWAWKVEEDPSITKEINGDWRNIRYIAVSHEILKQVKNSSFPLIRNALDNSVKLELWNQNSIAYLDVAHHISTNGDWMGVYKVKDPPQIILDNSWNYYKSNFMVSYGQIIDPHNNFYTTSEGQSYAMLRAVWDNDKSSFDSIWSWTRDHLEFRQEDKLFSWLWQKKDDKYMVGDSASASDADEDIALALLFASKQWQRPDYLKSAQSILRDIWRQEVVSVNQHYYLISGTGAERPEGYLVNPSYLSPASYRIFAQADPAHPWNKLASDSYYLLNKISAEKSNTSKLPSNWVLISKKNGEVMSASKYIQSDADTYGFDAFRVMFRVALDAKWFNTPEAIQYLQQAEPFYLSQWQEKGSFPAIFDLSSNGKVAYSTISTNAGAVSDFIMTDPSLSGAVYDKLYMNQLNSSQDYWGDRTNYYDQNWAWFITAFYYNRLPNLWE